jgi:hypothetical protein
LTSLQPLVTKGNIVTDNRITGRWQHDGQVIQIENINRENRVSSGTMKRSTNKNDSVFISKTYRVVFEQKGIRHVMSGALTRIDNNLFFELMPALISDPEQPDGSGYEYAFDYLDSFTFGKLSINNNELTLQFLNGDFIKEQINNGTMRIRHEKDELFGTFLITASSADMQQFILKYGNDDRLFSTKNSITLTRKG